MKKIQGTAEAGFSLLTVALLMGCSGEQNEGVNTILPPTTGQLLSISISPAASTAAACTPVQFTAQGSYSGESAPRDITSLVQWGVDTATLGIGKVGSGVATGFVPGAMEVEAYSGSFYASAVLNVSSAGTLSVNPNPASAVVGTQKIFTAKSSCGSDTLDVSNRAVWSSDNTLSAQIIPSSPLFNIPPGTVSAVAAGPANITATISGITATATLQVQ